MTLMSDDEPLPCCAMDLMYDVSGRYPQDVRREVRGFRTMDKTLLLCVSTPEEPQLEEVLREEGFSMILQFPRRSGITKAVLTYTDNKGHEEAQHNFLRLWALTQEK